MRAVAISADGSEAVSGSFDTSAIRWSLKRNVAEQVLRFHDAAVNAVALLPDRRIVTAGADGKIALWTEGNAAPDRTLDGHTAPVAGLAVSPDGKTLASASWDRTVQAMAARRWACARARGPHAERQRRRLLAGRQERDQRRL